MHSGVNKPERETQNRVITLFSEELAYQFLGSFQDRPNNSNIEETLLTEYLKSRGYTKNHITRAIHLLRTAAAGYGKSLYETNREVYSLLRYGAILKIDPGTPNDTVHLIDWTNPEANDFSIAEEVSIEGDHEKRPDLVLYVNGIALAVIELKNSRKDLAEGIRQNLTNQRPEFIQQFFTTIQFCFAGNDTQGLRYGTIGTQEKYYLAWKEDPEENEGYKLDKYLKKMCRKERFLDLIYNFVVYDAGRKKLPRVHQYFAVKEAQLFIRRREGGIIWHTQGSGKSITMVFLAKWILENRPDARVLIVTDRDELDKQIKNVFVAAGEKKIKRSRSSRELISQLQEPRYRLLCSLIHKFGQREAQDFDAYIHDLESGPSLTAGEVYVFVDECHRTQSGRLHRAMKVVMPNAVLIGFTGTPLLKKDRTTSLEVFGRYIHTYKFNEAVEDGVILDLAYEARDIDQKISSPERIDEWFTTKTRGLNEFQKEALKERWGTMKTVLSSRSRMEKIVWDIVHDFNTKPRLSRGAGNAMLIASRIHEACRYFELFQRTELKNKCAIITSYNPQVRDIANEETGENTETEKEYIYQTYTSLLNEVQPAPGKSRTETYEDRAKERFVKEPINMKLLIVVDKLLTGFDAPSCTYLYIDKSMQDHGLFQAICRVNRLEEEDKTIGYIIDYKDLFKKMENAVAVYTGELAYDQFEKEDVDILLESRITKGRERLNATLEAVELLCEDVPQPKQDLDYIHYFCGNTEVEADLKEREALRHSLYTAIARFIRAYANIADELEAAGYSSADNDYFQERMTFYLALRETIRIASNETLDLKSYEADMRHLIDTYIQAEDSRVISPFTDMSLLEIITTKGLAAAIEDLPSGIKGNKDAVAEVIENNVRSKIIKEQLLNPEFFEEMSVLLDEIIRERKRQAIEYQEYLKRIAELVKKFDPRQTNGYPHPIDTHGKRALYDNLGKDESLAIEVHEAVMRNKFANFRGDPVKERSVKGAIYEVVQNTDKTEELFQIIKGHNEY